MTAHFIGKDAQLAHKRERDKLSNVRQDAANKAPKIHHMWDHRRHLSRSPTSASRSTLFQVWNAREPRRVHVSG